MPDLWRISNFSTLNGEGGLRYAGRWHHAGRPVVYLAESPAGALLETLVHLELSPGALPPAFTLLRVAAPDDLPPVEFELPPGENWKAEIAITRELGSRWLAGNGSVLARVPSILLPNTFNLLFNPLHKDAARFAVAEATRAQLDGRLLRHLHS